MTEKQKVVMKDNQIFVGDKPMEVYMYAIHGMLFDKQKDEVEIVGRGKNILKAIDVVMCRFFHGKLTATSELGVVEFQDKFNEKKTIRISMITIRVKRKDAWKISWIWKIN